MHRATTTLSLACLAVLAASPARAQQELYKIGGPGGGSGSRVAMDGGLALGYSNGVRVLDVYSGVEVERLLAMGGHPDEYVASFAIDDGLAAVGRPTFNSDVATGAAYVFDVATGVQLARLAPDPAAIDSRFGLSIDIEGGRVLVGAEVDNQVASRAGAAYLYDAQTGQLLHQFLPPTSGVGQHFGSSVALLGDRVLIGAEGEPFGNPGHASAAYLYDTSGQLLQQWSTPSSDQRYFGLAVALTANVAAVSSFGDLTIGTVHTFDTATGALRGTIQAPLPLGNDRFGFELDADGTRLIAGAVQHTDVGDAYVFDVESGALLAHLIPSNGGLNDFFGSGVAVDGDLAFVGAPGNFNGTNDGGSMYLFAVGTLGQSVCAQMPNSTGSASTVAVSGSPSLAHELLHVRADSIPDGQPGIFFAGTSMVQLPLGNGTRCAGGNVVRLTRPAFSSGGVLAERLDFAGAASGLGAGTVYVQAWYRDNPAGGARSDVSDSVAVTLAP